MIAGIVAAGVVALAARYARTLSASGAVAGAGVGTLAVAAGWSWALILLAYFVAASGLSRVGGARKALAVGPVVEKGGERDARQVLASGGVYALAALAHLAWNSPVSYAVGLGALAASSADTWATEIGTLVGEDPISIISVRRVPAGTSGGVTLVGSVAGVAGALFVAAGGALARWPVPFTAVILGGVGGALSDSVVGATVQSRRWCDVCSEPTERLVHDCGNPTRHAGGLAGVDNDAVNAICCVVGALLTSVLS